MAAKATFTRASLLTAVAVSLLLSASSVLAAPILWTGPGDDWANAGNWAGAVPGPADTAIFGGAQPRTVNVPTAQSADGVQFSVGNYSIGGAGSLTLNSLTNLAGTNVVSNLLNSANLTGTISGGHLTVPNAGNTIAAGTWTVSGGTLKAETVSSANALGNTGVTLSGGTLELAGQIVETPGLEGLYYKRYNPQDTGQYPRGGPYGNGLIAFDSYANISGLLTSLGAPDDQVQLTVANDSYTHPDPSLRPKGSLDFPAGPTTATGLQGGAPNNLDDGPDVDQFTNMGISGYQNNIFAFWQGQLNISADDAGLYGFRTASDDGSIIYVDGVKVVDNNNYQGVTWRGNATPWYNLTEGLHDILIGFYEGGGGNGVLATWTPVRLYDYGTGTFSANTTNQEVVISGADPRVVTLSMVTDATVPNPITVTADSTLKVTTATNITLSSVNIPTPSRLTLSTPRSIDFGSLSTVPGSSLDIAAGTVVSPPGPSYIGQADLVLSGGTFEVEGSANVTNNAMEHFGFLRYPGDAAMMNLHLNATASMIHDRSPATHPNLTGQSVLTDGPGNRGLNFDSDADFVAAVNVPVDNYCNLWLATLHVDASKAGSWTFRDADRDDWGGIWIDLNRNGVFESNGNLNSNQGEQLAWNDQGAKTVSLASGDYLIAFTHLEGGGDSRMEYRVQAPGMGGEVTIKPTDPNQDGFWTIRSVNAIDMSSTDVSTTAFTSGSRLRATTDVGATFGTLTFGKDSDLTVAVSNPAAPVTFTGGIVTSGGTSSLGLSADVTTPAYDDQGIYASTLRLYGSKTLTIDAPFSTEPTPHAVSAKETTFQVDTGATLRVAGGGLLGGDPTIALNGGTFTVEPPPTTNTDPNAYMGLTDVRVLASSTLNSQLTGTLGLGGLSFEAPATLTLTGSGGPIAFINTEIRGTVSALGTLNDYSENFDSYAAGSQMHGQGGWAGWGNDPGAGALVSNALALSAPNSVDINGGSDLVHTFSGMTSGKWVIGAMQYFPSSSSQGPNNGPWFVNLNYYDPGTATYNWSADMNFGSYSGTPDTVTTVEGTPTPRPLVRDQWVPIRFEVDLDANVVRDYYNNQLVSTHPWYGAAQEIKAIDLFANGSDPVYYDDISLSRVVAVGFNTQVPTYAGGIDANGQAVRIDKTGAADLILTRAGSGLASANFDIQAGRLVAVGPDTVAGAMITLDGGNLVLGSRDGADATYSNVITSAQAGTVTAGSAGGGAATGNVILTGLAPGVGTQITLAGEGAHGIVLPNGVTAPGGSVAVSQGNVQIQAPVDMAGLTLNGGTTTTSSDLTLSNGLAGAGTLVTQGNLTIAPATSLNLSGELRIGAGNVTLSIPTSGVPASSAHWAFDEGSGTTAGDSSGSGRDGTISNGTWVAGLVGGALNFNNSNTYVTIPAGQIDLGNKSFSLSAWVQRSNLTDDFFMGTRDQNPGPSWNDRWLHVGFRNANQLTFAFYADDQEYVNAAKCNSTDWHHWTFTYDATTRQQSIYVDGQLAQAPQYRGPLQFNTPGPFFIGDHYAISNPFGGNIDEAFYFDRVVNAAEIQSLYQAGITGGYAPAIGDIRLDDGAQLTLTGPGQPSVNSIGATSSAPLVTGPMTLSNFGSPTAARTGDTVTIDSTINTSNFEVTGPGTIALKQNLTVPSGGSLTVASDAALATVNSLTIDAPSAYVRVKGDLNVAAGTTLTFNAPGNYGLPTGLQLQLDASTLGLANGATVSNWTDVSGAGHDADGVNGNPTYVTNALNGLAAVRFNASDGTDALWTTYNFDPLTEYTVLTVEHYTGGANSRVTTSRTRNWLFGVHGGLEDRWHAEGWIYPPGGSGGTPATTNWNIYAGTITSAADPVANFWRNGLQLAFDSTGSGNGNHMIGQLQLGAWGTGYSEPSNADIAEVLVFNHVLTADELNDVGGYLASKYGLSTSYTGSFGPVALGNLTLGSGSQLILGGSNTAEFASITTTGPAAAIQGNPILTGEMAVGGSSPGTLNVTGNFTMAAGSTYHWKHDGATGDLVAVVGDIATTGDVNIGVSLGAALPSGTHGVYDLGTFTGSLTIGGGVTLLKENAYAKLVNSWAPGAVIGSPNRLVLDLTMVDTTTWTSNSGSGGTIDWQTPGNWSAGVPTPTTAAIVKAPAADQVATVLPGVTGQAQSLIVDNSGHVRVEQGGRLDVTVDADVLSTGSLTVNGTLKVGTTTITSFGPANLPSGLVSYWPFDTSLTDVAGGHNGTYEIGSAGSYTPGTAAYTPGKVGDAVQLSGNQFVLISDTAPYSFGAGGTGMSISAWVKADALVPDWQAIVAKGEGNAFRLHRWGGGTGVAWNAGGGGDIGNNTANFTDQEWHHVVATHDGVGTISLWVDGVLVSAGGHTGIDDRVANFLMLGENPDAGGRQWRGALDDVAIWNRPLDAAEVQALFQIWTTTQVGGTLTTAGTTIFGPNAILDIPRIDVVGGTTQGGLLWPPSARATLQPDTRLRLAGGQLTGGFNLTNTSTTPGSYALEVENGLVTANIIGPTASMRKTTAGAATFTGAVDLDTIRMEDGSLTISDGPRLTASTVTVTGGSLKSARENTIGTLDLQGGTTTLTRNTSVTTALQGTGTLIADGDFDIDASSALVTFDGTLRVANSVPATSGNLLVKVPGAMAMPHSMIGYWPFNEGSGATTADLSGGGNTGTINANASWVNDPTRGWVLDFPSSGSVTIPSAAFAALAGAGQVTISLWQYGDPAVQPRADYVFEGRNASGQRVLGSHLPWDNSRIYWDAGNTGSSYDRLDGPAADSDFEGQWNQWVFVKDATAGTLSMYRNAQLWLSGGGRTRNMEPITSFRIGADGGGGTSYDGMIDEFAVWNRALSASEIATLFYGGTFNPRLGNLRLDPDTQITLGGAGAAAFDTIGATGGLTIGSGLDVAPTVSGPANIRGTGTGVHFNAQVTAPSFTVAGPGTVSLGRDAVLTIASGGSLDVPAGVTISANPGTGGTATIDASQAAVNYKGGLNVASGTLTLNAAPGGVALPGGAIAHWGFNDAADLGKDTMGSYNGTLMGSPAPVQAPGMIGGAIDLEHGNNNYVDLPDGFANFDNGISVAAWVKYESFNNWNRIIDFGNGADVDNILLARRGWSDDGQWDFRDTAAGTESQLFDNYLPNDTWIHIAAVTEPGAADACRSTIYINGVAVNVVTNFSVPRNVTRTNNYIGESNWPDDNFDGLMDELVMYDRPLSPTEVQNLYRAGMQGGYGAVRFGDLTMAPGTTLIAGTAPVGFSTATLGDGATLTGDITVDRRITPGGLASASVLINGPTGADGDLRIGDGLVYEWSFAKYDRDLITVLGDLHFDGAFTLSLFGAGGTILPTDWIPVFLYTGDLYLPPGESALQYVIDIGNLVDPDNVYVWDATTAELFVGLHDERQGIWLHGLFAAVIPEPGTLTVLALGALVLLRRRRRGASK